MKKTLVLIICVLLTGSTALADWDDTDPYKMHYPQLPDLSTAGMAVMNGNYYNPGGPSMKKVLADDFECTATGPITDIHIWGSWKDDNLPETDAAGTQDPGAMVFHIEIWSDIPDPDGPTGDGYSMPGQMQWKGAFGPPDGFTVREVTPTNPDKGDWYDPNTQDWVNDDHSRTFQYNFDIPKADAFKQLGTTTTPITYWLLIDVMPWAGPNQAEDPVFGWKTSQNHWNDDATYSDWEWNQTDVKWDVGPWQEMVYPTGHEFAGQSVDLAFVITPEPTTMVLLGIGAVALIQRRRR